VGRWRASKVDIAVWAEMLCARLFWVLALPPLLAAWARLLLLLEGDEDDFEEEEEEELRDAIACSFGR